MTVDQGLDYRKIVGEYFEEAIRDVSGNACRINGKDAIFALTSDSGERPENYVLHSPRGFFKGDIVREGDLIEGIKGARDFTSSIPGSITLDQLSGGIERGSFLRGSWREAWLISLAPTVYLEVQVEPRGDRLYGTSFSVSRIPDTNIAGLFRDLARRRGQNG